MLVLRCASSDSRLVLMIEGMMLSYGCKNTADGADITSAVIQLPHC
jgi:hypothetical protein